MRLNVNVPWQQSQSQDRARYCNMCVQWLNAHIVEINWYVSRTFSHSIHQCSVKISKKSLCKLLTETLVETEKYHLPRPTDPIAVLATQTCICVWCHRGATWQRERVSEVGERDMVWTPKNTAPGEKRTKKCTQTKKVKKLRGERYHGGAETVRGVAIPVRNVLLYDL